MSSFNVTNHVQKNLRRAESSSSCSSASSKQACAAQQEDVYEKAPIKAANVSASSSAASFDPPPNKVPAKRQDSSSSSSSVQVVQQQQQRQDDKAPVGKGDPEAQVGARQSPSLNPAAYQKQLVECIQTADGYGWRHPSAYKQFREIANKLVKAHGNERDYDAILYPLDLRHRKCRTERECNRIDAGQQDQQEQSGKWVTVDRSPGGAVNLWAKAVYNETHGHQLKTVPDRKAARDLILSTCTLVEQADANMSDHALRLKVKTGKLHRHLRHIDKKLHTRKDAKAAEKAMAREAKGPEKAPAKKGFLGWFKRK